MLNLNSQKPLVINGNVLINRNNTVQIPGITGFEDLPSVPVTDQLPNVVNAPGSVLSDDYHQFELETTVGELVYLPPSNTVPLFYSLNHYCEAEVMPLNSHLTITAELPGQPVGGVNFKAMSNAFDFSILDKRDATPRVLTGKRGETDKARSFLKKHTDPEKDRLVDSLNEFSARMKGQAKVPSREKYHETRRRNIEKKMERQAERVERQNKRVTVEDVDEE